MLYFNTLLLIFNKIVRSSFFLVLKLYKINILIIQTNLIEMKTKETQD